MAIESVVKPRPERLPPTEKAAVFHVLRSHHQAVVWTTLNANVLDPLQWGWQEVDGKLVPRKTDASAAPDELLNMVRCKCKGGCSSVLCSCRKHGLKCVSTCSHCNGVDCTNTEPAEVYDNIYGSTESASEHEESIAVQASQLHDVMYDSDIDWVTEEVVDAIPVSFADSSHESSDIDSACEGEGPPANKRPQLQNVMFDNDIDWTVEGDVEAMSGVEVIIIAESPIFRLRVLIMSVESPALYYYHYIH